MSERLDVYAVACGLAPSRSKAREYIEAGEIFVDGVCRDKPSFAVCEGMTVERRAKEETEYVGRGGKKLEKALDFFGIELNGAVCADVGASTGGFTDCMLGRGAKKVYAIDVGSGQLAEKLRNDARVINMENTNVRYLSEDAVPEKADFLCADLSFISLTLVLEKFKMLLKPDGKAVCLVKPQFEAGREHVGKKGIVKDPAMREMCIVKVADFCRDIELLPVGITFSPIKGSDGNVEFLLLLSGNGREISRDMIKNAVKEAEKSLR